MKKMQGYCTKQLLRQGWPRNGPPVLRIISQLPCRSKNRNYEWVSLSFLLFFIFFTGSAAFDCLGLI